MTEIWTGSSIEVVRMSPSELGLFGDPKYTHRLVISGIVHDPHGEQPPPVLELRLTHKRVRRLGAQIQALQMGSWQSATNEARLKSEAVRVATSSSLTDTGQLQRIRVGLEKL